MILHILTGLVNRVGIIIVLAFILSKAKLFRNLVTKRKVSILDKFILSIFFGIFGIIGTYSGIKIQGALANSRVIGVFAGGLLGGPFVGIMSGFIAGLHRWAIDIGGFTAVACGISTTVEGILAGILSKKFYKSKNKWMFSLVAGAFAELVQMIIILIVAKPFSQALELVEIIGIPMITVNSIGISMFIAVTESIFKDQERAAAYQAQIALKIANKTLKYFRKGFNTDTAYKTAQIIYNMADLKAVAFTDTEKILAHVGAGEDHHKLGNPIKTNLTKSVIRTGKYKVANSQREIDCNNDSCSLKSAIIVPLKEKNKVIGTLKLYKTEEQSITQIDVELALGLALLFSTQIEVSKVEYQAKLLKDAELKALQAQINPHFLFNAINTIVSFVRIKPDKARELLLHLGSYFRKNLQQNKEEVELYKEIEHVKSYLEIEKARFGEKLKVKFHIPDNLTCYLPPLILQPIVENAVKHGIMEKLEGGTIEIKAIDEVDEVKLIVKDNGVGMDTLYVNSLFSQNKETSSVGLINVNNRLINKYGKEYGLKINSKLGKGTIVTMRIPKDTSERFKEVS
ncbi:sensor histidine kinase [Thermohalobacter berrensis]|uniref:histidine kinase n=1 Tax=Thermohalobacter berrensis TaxID=99594 RepID=A0A419T293_9FIRM|nr:sensor histidine kinase [Thermohalobacter berrensis]RKD31563.1 histidine kinase [Thermohalobacter berrensis]